MAERLIGTGTTNANGVASVTYTGNGRGKIGIIAKSGTIQSGTYSILDAIFYDKATNGTGEKNTNWTEQTGLTATPSSDGTVITSTANYKYYVANPSLSGVFEVRFEVKTTNEGCRVGFYNSSQYMLWKLPSLSDFAYVKLTYDNGSFTAKYSTDNTNWTNLSAISGSSITASPMYFELSNASSTLTLTYKNLKIYPI